MTTKKLLGLRKEISARRPRFTMQDKQKRPELRNTSWRRPKGLHSKMRHGVWGRPACVTVGYRGPAAVRGLHASGLMPVIVHTPAELDKIDAKTHGIVLGHIGGRKKTAVLTACKQKGFTVLNVKNVDATIKMITDAVAARKQSKKETATRKAEKTKAAPAKKEAPKEEVTKEQERKEMEKVITKRE